VGEEEEEEIRKNLPHTVSIANGIDHNAHRLRVVYFLAVIVLSSLDWYCADVFDDIAINLNPKAAISC
jgi:hypothetical protein